MTVPMNTGDVVVEEFQTTAVKLLEDGYAGVVNYGQGSDQWVTLAGRHDTFAAAAAEAGDAWDESFA